MTNNFKEDDSSLIYRIIDANLNRLKEGIRVCEDIQRYYYNNKKLALELKELRHLAKLSFSKELINSRDIINDPLKKSLKSESIRKNVYQISIANMKRAEESSRVLEEILKLLDKNEAEKFKKIRYSLYDIEKRV